MFTRSVLTGEQVAGTCPKNSNWFEFVGQVTRTKVWFLRLDFEMASSQDGTCPHALLQGLAASTSPLVCADSVYFACSAGQNRNRKWNDLMDLLIICQFFKQKCMTYPLSGLRLKYLKWRTSRWLCILVRFGCILL